MNITVPKNEYSHGLVFRPLQSRLLDIPQAPLCYWLRERFFELLTGEKLGDEADVHPGLCTGHDSRFTRFYWESPLVTWSFPPQERRWIAFEKGGGYGRWFGHQFWVVDWEHEGLRIKAAGLPGTRVQNERHYFKDGWTYSYMGQGSLGLRKISKSIFAHKSPAIFPPDKDQLVGAIANCRFASLMARSISATIQLPEGCVSRIPFSTINIDNATSTEQFCLFLAQSILSYQITERSFDPSIISRDRHLPTIGSAPMYLLILEGFLEHLVFGVYRLDADDITAVLDETGTPTAWLPLIQGFDALPDSPLELKQYDLRSKLAELLRALDHVNIHLGSSADLKSRLKYLYESGPGTSAETEEIESAETTEANEEQIAAGAHIPLPPETFLEELSQKLEIHPISVYWMLKEGIENEGWRCLPEERRITADRITVLILRLLGHRWPKQVETGEPIPQWADSEGIIPLTEGTAKSPLLDTLRKRLPSELGVPEASAFERDFPAVMGKSLDQWLETEFFKHHTKQFKKRPIAWQIQSGPFSKKRKPAFACLVYYHKLNADTFPKLRTHYVGPLRRRYETELHGIEAVPLDARSERQEKRRVLLENQIQELKDFDSRLEGIANVGFGPRGLRPALRQAAIDDAMLHLKAAWLDRLQDTIAKGPLPEWVHPARETAIECPIEDWIVEAFSHIAHHCSRLGPGSPEQGKMSRDPEASDLAELICPHSSEMIKGALSLGCNEWWQKVDSRLFRPFREKIQELRNEIKRLNDEVNQPDPSLPTKPKKSRDLDRQIKDIKAQIKHLKNQLDDQVSRAAQVREDIEGWECLEAETWEPWLGSQPLYDAISTLDGKQRPPGTVEEFVRQESIYAPDINDGVRVNIAPIQKAGLLLSDVLSTKDIDKAISDRIHWRSDERRWCREGRLPQPGWW